MKADGTYVELEGKFHFSINQFGLDYYNETKRKEAIKDFWNVFNEFLKKLDDFGYVSLDYKKSDLKVEVGE